LVIYDVGYRLKDVTLTFTNICPPDILDGTRTHTVYSLYLILPDDNIFKCSSILNTENSIRISSLGLASAANWFILAGNMSGIKGYLPPRS